ncbi:hypothetical protein [Phenylobacterium sp.]|uniref:hypothetical protein n=1 Tax=Phenylobacterium sp. TaxID=1871053 RepID=UPI003951C30B
MSAVEIAHAEPEVQPFDGAYRPHPLAELFPLIEGQAYWDLVADIREHGVREPVVMLDGMVLDGRNRYLAAREAGRPVPVVQYEGDDPLGFVVSLNLKRRHLNESQRAMVAAKLAKLPPGRPSAENPPNLGVSVPEAAKMLNVGRGTVESARRVQDRATPALIASVEAGAVSVSAAAEVAKLPEPVQVEIVEGGPVAIREAAKNIRAEIIDVSTGRARAPVASRKNPDYAPNPLRDAALALRDSAAEVSRIIGAHDGAALRAAFHDDASRDRAIAVLADARAALSAFLEIEHARTT